MASIGKSTRYKGFWKAACYSSFLGGVVPYCSRYCKIITAMLLGDCSHLRISGLVTTELICVVESSREEVKRSVLWVMFKISLQTFGEGGGRALSALRAEVWHRVYDDSQWQLTSAWSRGKQVIIWITVMIHE